MADALAGIRVLELAQAWSGPACTELLADFGADVIKVETRTRPDVARTMGPFPREFDIDASAYFLEWNRNKRSIELNLRDRDDLDTALELAARADVVVENFAPGVLTRLGLGYDVIRERNPAVVMLSISGFGSTGPDRAAVAYGQQIEAESGLMSITGYEGGPPLKPGVSYPDPVAALGGAMAVMAALIHRDRSGTGQWIDLSMLEITTALLAEPLARLAEGANPGRQGNASCHYAPHGVYPCLGADRWIAIECHDEVEWNALTRVAACPEWTRDPRFADLGSRLEHRRALDALMAGWASTCERDQLAQALQTAGVPAGPVADIADLVDDPHLRERGYWTEFVHPRMGPFRAHGALTRLEGTPARFRLPPPLLGEHSEAIRSELTDG